MVVNAENQNDFINKMCSIEICPCIPFWLLTVAASLYAFIIHHISQCLYDIRFDSGRLLTYLRTTYLPLKCADCFPQHQYHNMNKKIRGQMASATCCPHR